MAITVTRPTSVNGSLFSIGNKRISVRDVAFTGSYAAGGESITPSSVGLHTILQVHGVVTEGAAATAALPIRWDSVAGKLQMYESAASGSPGGEKGAEAYAASTSGRLTFFGT